MNDVVGLLARMGAAVVAAGLVVGVAVAQEAGAEDPIKTLQNDAVAGQAKKAKRAYHWGSQGANDVFSNHTSHSNRLIPIYTFGKALDLAAVTGKNSAYRDAEKIKTLFGSLPENTLNPEANYCDQSDLYHVQKAAAAKPGVKYMFTVWFDGMDYHATRAAAIAKTGKVYVEGKGSGLIFQDYDAQGTTQFGYCVTSPTHDKNDLDVDAQTVAIPATSLLGGYDPKIAGPNPWTEGPIKAPGYLKGQSGNASDKKGVADAGRVLHAYPDSSCTAGEYATGFKSYNNGVNVCEDGRFVPTLYHDWQEKGWKVGTVTSVPFDHASPAAMYAHNVFRDDYQDLARDMLGLSSIAQEDKKLPLQPGLDVVLGAGYGGTTPDEVLSKNQGKNAAKNQNMYIADADLKAIDVKNGGKYVVAVRKPEVPGAKALQTAADEAARNGKRLFGMYGTAHGHLPYRTTNGDFKPAQGIRGVRETYADADLIENPTLADMTRAALTVMSAEKGMPFALFVEAGDVDFALHDNNLDNAIGAVYSGEAAIQVIIDWVEKNSNWDESAMIVTADHGHYLVIDDPEALAKAAKGPKSPPR